MIKVTHIKPTDSIIVDMGYLRPFSLKPGTSCLGTREVATQLRVRTVLAELKS